MLTWAFRPCLGVTGGSAHFYHLFREACIRKTELLLGRPAENATVQRIEVEFDRRKLDGTINDTLKQVFELREAESGVLIALSFEAEELYEMWHLAHAGPLALFEKMVEELAGKNSPGSCIVVSGGSSRHTFLKTEILGICEKNSISGKDVVWTDSIELTNL